MPMDTKLLRFVTVLACAASLEGCNSPNGCITPLRDGIRLQVEDANTGRSLNSSAIVTISRLSPPPTESRTGSIAPHSQDNPLQLAQSRPGTYDVSVSSPGYKSRSERVTVGQEESFCRELKTVELTIRLEPS